MKKFFLTLAALIAVTTMFSQTEASAGMRHMHHFKHFKKPPTGVSSNGGMSGAGYYALGGAFCTAGTLIVTASIVGNTQHRELSQEEAVTALTTCFVPPSILLACNSPWATNNSLPVSVRRIARNRQNVFCGGLTFPAN